MIERIGILYFLDIPLPEDLNFNQLEKLPSIEIKIDEDENRRILDIETYQKVLPDHYPLDIENSFVQFKMKKDEETKRSILSIEIEAFDTNGNERNLEELDLFILRVMNLKNSPRQYSFKGYKKRSKTFTFRLSL